MRTARIRLVRSVAVARSTWGTVLLFGGRAVLEASGVRPTTSTAVTARLLGGRQLVQGVLTGLMPERAVVMAGATADGLHAVTALGLATFSRRWRTVALADAAVATTLAATGCWLGSASRRAVDGVRPFPSLNGLGAGRRSSGAPGLPRGRTRR